MSIVSPTHPSDHCELFSQRQSANSQIFSGQRLVAYRMFKHHFYGRPLHRLYHHVVDALRRGSVKLTQVQREAFLSIALGREGLCFALSLDGNENPPAPFVFRDGCRVQIMCRRVYQRCSKGGKGRNGDEPRYPYTQPLDFARIFPLFGNY